MIRKRTILILFLISLLLIGATIFTVLRVIPAEKYERGVNLLREKRFDEAKEIFLSLGDYKDSRTLALSCEPKEEAPEPWYYPEDPVPLPEPLPLPEPEPEPEPIEITDTFWQKIDFFASAASNTGYDDFSIYSQFANVTIDNVVFTDGKTGSLICSFDFNDLKIPSDKEVYRENGFECKAVVSAETDAGNGVCKFGKSGYFNVNANSFSSIFERYYESKTLEFDVRFDGVGGSLLSAVHVFGSQSLTWQFDAGPGYAILRTLPGSEATTDTQETNFVPGEWYHATIRIEHEPVGSYIASVSTYMKKQ